MWVFQLNAINVKDLDIEYTNNKVIVEDMNYLMKINLPDISRISILIFNLANKSSARISQSESIKKIK